MSAVVPGLSVSEIARQLLHIGRNARWVDVAPAHAGEDPKTLLRPGSQNVQSTATSSGVDRAEVPGEDAVLVGAVRDAQNNYVTVVALDVLEVLHKERILALLVEEPLDGRIFPAHAVELVEDQVRLLDTECPDAKALALMLGPACLRLDVFHHGPGDRGRLHRILSLPRVVAVLEELELEAEILPRPIRMRESHEWFVLVELLVGKTDQGLVEAPAVPAESEARGARDRDFVENALEARPHVQLLLKVVVLHLHIEEIGGRELARVPDHNDLFGANESADGVRRSNLAGFVENE